MGSVYEAEDTVSSTRVAVKLVTAERRFGTALVRRFHREAKAATAISSDHIVKVIDAGVAPDTGLPFMIMEYLVGEDLEALLAQTGPLYPDSALRIIGQVCAGLACAHEAGIVHRDIKPANIFLARPDPDAILVKILDFGIAKLIHEDVADPASAQQVLTRTGAMLGSPLYMSPEQARGIREIDQRTDVWSAGVALHVALAGRAPHQGIEAVGDLMMAVCSKPAAPIRDQAPWVSPPIAAIVHRALQIAPEERFPTMSAMLQAIQDVVGVDLTLRREMLRPLQPDDREGEARAPAATTLVGDTGRISVQVQVTPGPIDLGDTAMSDSDPSPPRRAETPAAAISAPDPPSHPEATASDEVPRPRPKPRVPTLAIVAVLGLVAAGAMAIRGASPPATGVGASDVATRTGLSPVQAPSIPSNDHAAMRVRLRIDPSDAAVEIDGAAARPSDGFVEITGELGSRHRVRLTKGADDVTADVVIAVDGLFPREISLRAAPSATPPAPSGNTRPPAIRPGPTSAASLAPSNKQPPPPAPPGEASGIETEFK